MDLPEVFVVGSLWFWLLLLGETIALIVLLEWDQGAIATLTLIATLGLLQFLGDVNLFGYVIEHPLTIALGAVGYFVAGTFWSIAKWWFYVREQRGLYDELRSAFVRVHGLDPQGTLPESLQPQWQQCLTVARKNGRHLDVHPLAAHHKAGIVRWMSYWPWSLVWTVLKDPVRKAFLSIYHQIQAHLQEISDRAFKGIEADLPKETKADSKRPIDPVLAEFGVEHVVAPEPEPRPQDRAGNPRR
jgi:hypothetical protein